MATDAAPPATDVLPSLSLEELRDVLKRLDDAYELKHGAKSCRAIIASDPRWEAAYRRLKASEASVAAEARVAGGCAKYIPRRRRYCASRAADGCDGYCSLHAPALGDVPVAAAAATATDDDDDDDGGASSSSRRRKTNIHRRMKKMTNPMAAPHRAPTPPPVWSAVFADATLPSLVDVGCAKGKFLRRAATTDADLLERRRGKHNLLGLEIYEPLVAEANAWTRTARRGGGGGGGGDDGRGGGDASTSAAATAAVDNLHFIACNANVSLRGLRVPNLSVVTILFPDPWSRKKHANRRVVTPAFVRTLADALTRGGRVYCCSDVKPLATEMYALFLGHGAFELDDEMYAELGETREGEGEGEGEGASVAGAGDEAKTTTTTTKTKTGGDAGGFQHVFPAHRYEWKSQTAPVGDEDDGDEDAAGGESRATTTTTTTTTTSSPRWLASNPYLVPTERDLVCESKWRPVYRFVARRR